MCKAVGAKDYKRVREYSNTIQLLFLFFGVIMSTLVFLLRKPFVSLYQLDESTFALATLMIAICSVSLLGTTYHASCFLGINRGAGDSKFVMLVDVFCGWFVVIPAAFLGAFVFHFPLIRASNGSSPLSACAATSGSRTSPAKPHKGESHDSGCFRASRASRRSLRFQLFRPLWAAFLRF